MPLTPEQLAARAHGIGGSDAGAIVGVSPWASPFDVFARLRPDIIPSERVETEAARWGTILEAPIAEEYARRERVQLATVETTLRHPDYPWMLAHPDRLISGGGKPSGVLEVKTAGIRQAHRWGDEGGDEVPEEYRLQVAHYLAVTDRARADLAVLIGGQEFRVYRLARDRGLEALLIEALADFWERHVVPGVPPPVGESPRAAEWIDRLHPRNVAGMRRATDVEALTAVKYALERDAEKKAKEAKKAAGIVLRGSIGDAEGIWWGDDPKRPCKATWTNNTDSAKTDWEALARSLNPPENLIAQYTRTMPGPRVLRVAIKE